MAVIRIDHDASWAHGWSARPLNGSWPTKFFADKKHGGRAKAHAAAIRFHDAAKLVLVLSGIETQADVNRRRDEIRGIMTRTTARMSLP